MNQQLARECAAVGLGFISALDDAGLQTDLPELTSALDIALNDPRIFDAALADGPTPRRDDRADVQPGLGQLTARERVRRWQAER